MDIKNTNYQYGFLAKGFHWFIGIGILGLLAVGVYMTDLERSPFKFELYGIHKALGIAVLALACLRFIWRFVNIQPEHLPTHEVWERILSKITHVGLYIAMIGMPLSGWVMSSAGGYPISFFGLFPVPAIVDKNPDLGGFAHSAHTVFGYVLLVLVGLHLAGAIKHHIVDRDGTLGRMVCDRLGFMGGLMILLLGALMLASAIYFVALRLIFA